MSTRCNIIVKDDRSCIQLYRHADGYPDTPYGVLATLPQAFEFAWPLPRFEADDFAAAIVAAWKKSGGGDIYIDGEAAPGYLTSRLHGDIEYWYLIEKGDGQSIKVTTHSMYGDKKPVTCEIKQD